MKTIFFCPLCWIEKRMVQLTSASVTELQWHRPRLGDLRWCRWSTLGSEVCFSSSFKDAKKCDWQWLTCSTAVILSIPSDARQILSQWFVPAVITQFCPQGNGKMFHYVSDWSGTKANIWTAAAIRWTKGNLQVVFLRKHQVDCMTTNTPDVCHASLETVSKLDLCDWCHDWQL